MNKRDLVFPNLGKYNFQGSERIRVEEDSKYSEEEKPFQSMMSLNDPNKLFVSEKLKQFKEKMRTRDINRKVMLQFEEIQAKKSIG